MLNFPVIVAWGIFLHSAYGTTGKRGYYCGDDDHHDQHQHHTNHRGYAIFNVLLSLLSPRDCHIFLENGLTRCCKTTLTVTISPVLELFPAIA